MFCGLYNKRKIQLHAATSIVGQKLDWAFQRLSHKFFISVSVTHCYHPTYIWGLRTCSGDIVKQKQKSKPFLYHSAMVISDLFPHGPMIQGYRLHTTGLLSRRAPGSSLKTEHWPLFSELRLNKGFPGGTSGKESETQLRFLGQEDPLEEGVATYSSILT